MQKLRVDDVMPLSEYEATRPAFRAKVIEHKKQRRVLLGPEMSLLFEDRLTVLNQVLEMVRAERLTRPEAIADEVAVYNDLIADDGCLLATLMIEISDAAQRAIRQRDYVGLEEHLHIELDGERTTARFDPKGIEPGQISVVQYVTFSVGERGAAQLRDLAKPARLVCTHPRYGFAVELSENTRRSLANDLEKKVD
jgi:Protein of unknown function (DUF3501)